MTTPTRLLQKPTGAPLLLQSEAEFFAHAAQQARIFRPQHTGLFRGKYWVINNHHLLDLTSLDYLGLGAHPAVIEIVHDAVRTVGDIACPGSQVFVRAEQFIELEQTLAQFHKYPCEAGTVLMITGFDTNIGIMEALGVRTGSFFVDRYADVIGQAPTLDIPTVFIMDGESHFSMRHGIRMARAIRGSMCQLRKFPAGDYDALRTQLLESYAEYGDDAFRVIVTDSVVSTNGRVFNLQPLFRLAEEFDTLVYVDEAHSVGVIGEGGRGVVTNMPEFERYRDRTIVMGTLTKAFVRVGGYVVTPSQNIADFLAYVSPPHFFSAPIPPVDAVIATHIVRLVAGSEGDHLRARLRQVATEIRSRLLAADFQLLGAEQHILPIFIGKDEVASHVQRALVARGYMTPLFSPPTVPEGESNLRLSIRADLNEEDIDGIVSALIDVRAAIPF